MQGKRLLAIAAGAIRKKLMKGPIGRRWVSIVENGVKDVRRNQDEISVDE